MLNAFASLVFYTRFLPSFSRLGFGLRAREFTPPAGAPAAFDFQGQRFVVSGATGGIGCAIALGAAAGGADVVALARDASKLAALEAQGQGQGRGRGHGRVQGFVVDLASVAATRCTARALAAQGPIDVLFNNVGLMRHGFARSSEGVELGFATNLLNHFALTEGLRERGALGADSLIVNMSSGGMYGAKLALDELEAESAERHNGFAAYAQHKRAQVELSRYWNSLGAGGPRACVMHPGWVDTDGVRDALPRFRRVLKRALRTPEMGADTALWLAATRPEASAGGIWLDRALRTEHAFGFTRGGADAAALAKWLRSRLQALDSAP